jgi:curved DNA-binding protein CbpA
MALRTHPDKNGGKAEQFKLVNEANEILKDKSLRAFYDRTGFLTLQQQRRSFERFEKLAPGTVVEICDLRSCEELNGQRAVVQSFDGNTQRFHIAIGNGHVPKAVRQDNIRPVS